MKNFRDVIDLWSDVTEMATDLGKKPNLIRKWRERNSIPSDEWIAVVNAAEQRKYPVDLTLLANFASSRKRAEAA